MIASLWVDHASHALDERLAILDDTLTLTAVERERRESAEVIAKMRAAGIEVAGA